MIEKHGKKFASQAELRRFESHRGGDATSPRAEQYRSLVDEIVFKYLDKCDTVYPDGSSAEDVERDLVNPVLDLIGSLQTPVSETAEYCEGSKAYRVEGMEGEPLYIPLCGDHAATWFTERNHLKGGMDAKCIVCAHDFSTRSATRLNESAAPQENYIPIGRLHRSSGRLTGDGGEVRFNQDAFSIPLPVHGMLRVYRKEGEDAE